MSFEWSTEWILALGTAVLALSAWGTLLWNKPKLEAEAEHFTWQTATAQLNFLVDEVERLQNKVGEYRQELERAMRAEQELEAEIRTLREKVQTLHDFIVSQGLEPPTGLDT